MKKNIYITLISLFSLNCFGMEVVPNNLALNISTQHFLDKDSDSLNEDEFEKWQEEFVDFYKPCPNRLCLKDLEWQAKTNTTIATNEKEAFFEQKEVHLHEAVTTKPITTQTTSLTQQLPQVNKKKPVAQTTKITTHQMTTEQVLAEARKAFFKKWNVNSEKKFMKAMHQYCLKTGKRELASTTMVNASIIGYMYDYSKKSITYTISKAQHDPADVKKRMLKFKPNQTTEHPCIEALQYEFEAQEYNNLFIQLSSMCASSKKRSIVGEIDDFSGCKHCWSYDSTLNEICVVSKLISK